MSSSSSGTCEPGGAMFRLEQPSGLAELPFGTRLEEAAWRLGAPLGVFPPGQSSGRGVVAMWDWGNALFGGDGGCDAVHLAPGILCRMGEATVGGNRFKGVVEQLRRADPDLIVSRSAAASPRWGVEVRARKGRAGGRLSSGLRVCPPGSIELEAELIGALARRLLPRFPSPRDLAKGLSYGRLARSERAVIEGAMDSGRWAFALSCLLYAIDKRGAALTCKEAGCLKALVERLGVDDVPEGFLPTSSVRPRGTCPRAPR